MIVLKMKNLIIGFFIAFFLFVGIGITFDGSKIETNSKVRTNIIVVDAGHGWPDGGATSGNIAEADLNLSIAKKLEEELINLGFDVVMTRTNENSIGDIGNDNTISRIKQTDLNNRVKIINESNADFCISIHMNKYSSSKYWGWQTFYNKNSEEGQLLAESIQAGIGEVIDKENKRQALKIEGIKIVDKTNIPVVIVECGFISNLEEASLLQQGEYQDKLVLGICKGIQKLMEIE